MKLSAIILLCVFLGVTLAAAEILAEEKPGDRLTVAGAIKNLQGRGVKEVLVEVLLNGRHLKTHLPRFFAATFT
jgi:hypothetical protein